MTGFSGVEHFAEADAETVTGRQLAAIEDAAPAFQRWFRATGTPDGIRTCDLIALPYPREFALWRASSSPAPLVRIFNRMLVIQWPDGSGQTRTLLFEPTEYALAERTPFFQQLDHRFRKVSSVRHRLVETHGTVLEHLARLAIAPGDVDYITFDHLHTQDVRPWLGTTAPQPDLVGTEYASGFGDEPVQALFPNATLLVMREEWEMLGALHPLQRRWFQPDTFRDLPTHKVQVLDGDTLVAPGVALLRTPGHTLGNHTLVLNTRSGIWTSSENGVHPECYEPAASRLPGMARLCAEYGIEVVLNANTPELTATQYNSMIKEKRIADRGGPGGEWPQHFASSELTPWALAPGCGPGFTYGGITHGELASSPEPPRRVSPADGVPPDRRDGSPTGGHSTGW